MRMLSHRLQILLDEERYGRLSGEARRRGVSIGALIREAIDAQFAPVNAKRAKALRSFLAADDIVVPDDPAALKRTLSDERAGLA